MNHLNTVPLIPKVYDNLLSKILWSIVSKAALWSNEVRSETSLLSALQRRLSVTLSKSVSLLWFGLYADWQTSRRLFLDRWDSSCARTTFSRILERNGRLETGLKFFRSFTSSPGFFSRGLTMADLKQSGAMPVVREVFMILVMTGTRASRYCLVRDVGIGSSLQLFKAVFKISSSMLASVTGSKSQNLEPVNGSKTGGSADWVSMSFLICSILLLKNWQNVSGRSLVGMLLGSEDFLVLPSSLLVTLYSCLEEGQLQITSL